MKKMPTKVVIYMAGGSIQGVHSDRPVEIVIVDKDDLVEEYGLSSSERDSLYKKTIKGCKATDNWGFVPNPKKV